MSDNFAAKLHKAAEGAIDEDHRSLAEDILDVIKVVDPMIRADERMIMCNEMAALSRELEATGRPAAGSVVQQMWNRACRRRAKHS